MLKILVRRIEVIVKMQNEKKRLGGVLFEGGGGGGGGQKNSSYCENTRKKVGGLGVGQN